MTEISGGGSGNDVLSGTHIITAQAPPGSKMTLSSSGRNLLWAEDDLINLFDGEGADSDKNPGWKTYRSYKCNRVEDGGAVAKFTNIGTEVTSGKEVYYAHYPQYGQCEILYGSGYIHSWITYNQSAKYNADNTGKYPGEGVLPAYRDWATPNTLMNVAVAKSASKDGPYSFKNIHSLLRFTVPSSEEGVINRFKLAAYSDEVSPDYTAFSNTDYLCGDLLIDYSEGKDIPDVKLMCDEYDEDDYAYRKRYAECSLWAGTANSDAFAAGDYRMAIRPCSIKNGLHLWFRTTEEDAEGNPSTTYDYVRASFGQKTFARNTPYYMGEVRRPAATTKAAGVTGITFPYVMSFRTNGADRGQKYVTVPSGYDYNKSDDTVTQVVTDPSTGATLTAVGCHKNVDVETAYTCYVHSDNAGRDYYSRHSYACSFSRNNENEVMQKEAGMRFTFPLAEDAPSRMNLFFGLEGGEYACKYWRVLYTTDPDGYWCKAGDVSLNSNGKYEEFCVPFCPPASMAAHLKKGNVLHIKIVPVKTETAGGHTAAEANLTTIGHGWAESTHVNLFSCVALTDATEGHTDRPAGGEEIIHFVPFDDNVGGLDYRCDWDANGGRGVLGSFTNFAGDEQSLSGWTCTNVRVRPGYAQIGYVNSNGTDPASWTCATGSLTSPAFPAAGNYLLSFKAMAYATNARGTSADYTSPDLTSIQLTLSAGTFVASGLSTIVLNNIPTADFSQKELYITGATAATTVTFTSPTGTFTRWFIDDICLRRANSFHQDLEDGGIFNW